ncbi:hypothetical protein ACFOY4_43725 [Actinomadura syzygii]|uniref:Arginase family protein n=1 Tax=Actinomadura syzygii TaxID=1427538 RepID=A0A5D0TM26_9ACTN|nr:arginase family protein [Actinomadura syzygii]TYC07321.1 arginase family protein [Actinomadura syzygii]
MPEEATTRPTDLCFFTDRGLGSRLLPNALREAGWVLETMDERYGKAQSQRISDRQWIEEATLNGDVILCKDLRIATNELEAQAVYMTGARVFGLANRRLTGPQMIDTFLTRRSEITEVSLRAQGPYVMSVSLEHALKRLKLAYPAAS